MRIYKLKSFAKFADREKIDDATLVETITRANSGLIDADLGNGIIKQRIARKGQGKSSAYRTLIFYRINGNHFFVAGFAKSVQSNISSQDLQALKILADQFKQYDLEALNKLLLNGKMTEIK